MNSSMAQQREGLRLDPNRGLRRLLAIARRTLMRLTLRWGWRGLAAFIVCAAGLTGGSLSIGSSWAEIARLRSSQLALQPATAAPLPTRLSDPDRLFERLGTESALPERLSGLIQCGADNGLLISDGTYTVTREERGHVVRYQVLLPLRGTYPQLRRFLAAVLRQPGPVALAQVQFSRKKVSDPAIEAAVRLVYFMKATP
jgi:hypothetical protein